MLLRLVAVLAASVLAVDGFANSNGTSHTLRTWRDVQSQPTPAQQDSASCGSCHGTRGTITVTLSGPASLAAGQQGSYTVSIAGGTNGDYMGMVVSTTDSVATNPFSGTAPLTPASNLTIVHSSASSSPGPSTLTRVSAAGTASYSFNYTMPAGATVGSTRTLHAVVRTGITSGLEGRWNHANISAGVPQGLVVTTAAAPPTAPTSLTLSSKTASSATLNWGGGGPAYRLVYKTGTTPPASQTDGTTVDYPGTTTSATISGLNAGPNYSFRIYARSADSLQFAAGPSLNVVLPPAITSSNATVNGTVNAALAAYSITATNSPTGYGLTGQPPGVTVNASGAISGAPTQKGTYNATLSATNAGGTGTLGKTYQIAGLVQVITFGAAPTPSFTPGGTFTVSASSNAGLAITFSTLSATCSLQSSTTTTATFVMLGVGACQVRADQFSGNSVYEPAAQVTQTVNIAAGPPGAPVIGSAQPGNGSATVSFSAPSFDGGSAIMSYTATCGAGTASGPASPLTVTGLANGVQVNCSVTATNGVGTGPASASLAVTPTADPDGRLDPIFGTAGLTAPIFSNTGAGESARAILVDRDQRILVGGGYNLGGGPVLAVARFLPDGTLDAGFGTNGIATVETAGVNSAIEGLALARDGSILFAGATGSTGSAATFTVGRLLSDGALDESFAKGGYLTIKEASQGQGVARTIAWDDVNGHVVAAGWDKVSGDALRVVVVRLDESGARVGGFGTDGVLVFSLGEKAGGLAEGAVTGLAIDSSGGAVAGGFANFGATGLDVFALRASVAGLDPDYGIGGIARRDVAGANASDVSLSLRADGKDRVSLVGYTSASGNFDFLLVRFDNKGGFLQEVVSDQGGNQTDVASSLVVTADGKRLVGGYRNGGVSSFDFAFARFLDTGSLDATFGGTGRVSIPIPGTDQLIAMQAHLPGTVVALVQTGGQQRVARFAIEAPLPFAFTPASITAVGTSTLVQSNAVALQGLAGETYVRVQGGEWSRNCAANLFTTGDGAIGPGETVCVRHVTAASTGVTTTTTLTVGGQSATYSSTPNAVAGPKTLTVAKSGLGQGVVQSSPGGIDCGATCNASFATNQPVSLFASPAVGSVFAGWGGACTGTGACNVTMDAAKSVTATFSPQQFALTVSKPGAGSGTVTSSPTGINCGATCNANFNAGVMVTLTAAATAGSTFTGWSGGSCSGTGTCQVTMNSVQGVTATFDLAAGMISPSPASLDFGGQSMNTTAPSLAVTLTNGGGSAVTISSVTASTYFAVTHDCATVNAGASCTANVAFTPTAEGSLNGALTVATSAGNVTVPLAGTGERSLVTHYYRSILRRAPDAGGKAFWESEKVRLQGLGANLNETWYAMATFFFFSPEYASFNRDDTGFVTDLYNTFFNRGPDGGGLAFWTGQLSQGMPREVVLVSFMFSSEFQSFTQAIFGNVAARKEVDTVVDLSSSPSRRRSSATWRRGRKWTRWWTSTGGCSPGCPTTGASRAGWGSSASPNAKGRGRCTRRWSRSPAALPTAGNTPAATARTRSTWAISTTRS